MNGRVTPVFGIVFVTTAIFRITCTEMCVITPVTISAPYRSFAFPATRMNLQISMRNRNMMAIAPNNPSSSQIIEKIMSFCASGTNAFCILCPRPLPKMPPEPMA